jgi:hypothetical protein
MSTEAEMAPSASDNARRDEVLRRFLFREPTTFFEPLETEISILTGDNADHAKALLRNLEAAITVGSLPFNMVQVAVSSRHFQRIHMAERIRQLKDRQHDPTLTDEHERAALKIARERFQVEIGTEETRTQWIDAILNELGDYLAEPEFKMATDELLRQTLVMIWGAFETFVSDTIIANLNRNPKLATKLLLSDTTKRHFPQRGVAIDSLEKYDFDVGQSMGFVLFSERGLDSLPLIRDVISTLLPDDAVLNTSLKDPRLWLLWQRRNLIVHRRGVVDEQYVSKTSDKIPIGAHIEPDRYNLDDYLIFVRDICVLLIKATF